MDQQFETLPDGVSATQHVFDMIRARIQSLELAPGTKLSEADVARQCGISRQPVRDAFYRLSKQGFIIIRPQRATQVSRISPQVIIAARFMRCATELEMIRRATGLVTADDGARLQSLIDAQAKAVDVNDSDGFKGLDDQFHREICAICGLESVWDNIAESKAHTDRLRLLSIRDGSPQALQDHRDILAGLMSGDPERAADRMRVHLDRIKGVMEGLMISHAEWFTQEGEI